MATNDARDLAITIDRDRLKEIYQPEWLRLVLDLLLDWGVIILSAWLALAYLNLLTYILAVIVIGARMHALAVLMHDVSHFRFLNNRKLGDFIINLFVCWPMFVTVAKYRANHLKHHQHLNTSEDPDWIAKESHPAFKHPQTRWQFLLRLFTYLIGVQGIRDVVWIFKRLSKQGKVKGKREYGGIIFNLGLFAALTVFEFWVPYLLFWIVPFFTTLLMFQYIRSFAEHFGDLEYDNLYHSIRTVNPNLIERFFIAPHNISYHMEHHLYPGVPYHNLPKLKALLMTDESYRVNAHYTDGYLSGLLREL
ncbi:MAG: fatty acid desaturase family protein [Flavobacteriales bacterium]|jgi:fatty acid desaturase